MESRAGKVMEALERNPEDQVWVPDTERRSFSIDVALEMPRFSRCQSCGLSADEAANRE